VQELFITLDGMKFAIKLRGLKMKNLFYFKLEDAEHMRKTYSSWIGKEAHTGKGKKQTLTGINIIQRRLHKPLAQDAIYKIEFIFDGQKKLSAYEFLFYNSLVNVAQAQNHEARATGSNA
jgi:hypothetical protein